MELDRRKALIGVLLALALTGLAFTAIGHAAHFGRLRATLARTDLVWLTLCALGQSLAYAGYTLAYRTVARASGGPRFGLLTTARIVLFGRGATVLGAAIGGLAVDFWALRRAGTSPHMAARRVLALGTLEWTILSAFALSAAVVVLIAGPNAARVMALVWLAVVPACVAAALWFTSPKRAARFTEAPFIAPPAGGAKFKRPLEAALTKSRRALGDAIAGVILVRHLL